MCARDRPPDASDPAMSILGNRVLRREDPKFLTVGGSYVADLEIPGVTHLCYVRSTVAHARVASLDLDEARNAPGVVAIFTNDDVGLAPLPPAMPMLNQEMTQTLLAGDVVRFVGEPIVAIVSETREQGADAAELVIVEYDPLPVVVDPEVARDGRAPPLPRARHEHRPRRWTSGLTPTLFDGCEVVVRQRIVNQRIAPCPLEGALLGQPASATTAGSSSSPPPRHRTACSVRSPSTLGLPAEQIHVVSPDVGGGFGAKGGVYPEEILVAWAGDAAGPAGAVDRDPVREHARPRPWPRAGPGRRPRREPRRADPRLSVAVLQDSGAYPAIGAILPLLTRMMAQRCLRHAQGRVHALVGRHQHDADRCLPRRRPARGHGRHRAHASTASRLEIGIDPAEVRRGTSSATAASPITTPDRDRPTTSATTGARSTWPWRWPVTRISGPSRRVGGPPTTRSARHRAVQSTSRSPTACPAASTASVEVRPDGRVIVRTGTSPHGQGHVDGVVDARGGRSRGADRATST